MMYIPLFLILSVASGQQVGHVDSEAVASLDECTDVLTHDRPLVEMFIKSHLGDGYKIGPGDCQEVDK